ncbi:MAG TPA: amino acid permease, partial [Candidatus Baltobacteraceae bacterium]|nr:amino acid permease [Candidatus Baltobacteraceae bacterium]
LASCYIGFANYAAYLYPPVGNNPAVHDTVAVGIGLITILTLYRRTSHVTAIGTLLAAAAALTVALVALAGLTHANFTQAFAMQAPIHFGSGLLAGFGTALYITLYDYVGYADVALLGDEVLQPRRTIPVSIVLSVLIVAVLYVLLQIGVLGVIPWRTLLDAHGVPTAQAQYVGSFVVEHVWGRWPAIAVTVLVLVTAFASLYGNLLGFSRIPFAAARDGAFLPIFARLHPRKEIPHVALLAVGFLSLLASFFTLDQVIAILTAGIVLVQGLAQIAALALLRSRRQPAPFRMPLYPLPAIVAALGWTLAFAYTGTLAIGLGIAWLVVGALVFLIVARVRRWWPFAAILIALAAAIPITCRAAAWNAHGTSQVVHDHGYSVFTVDGKPFFVYGAAFFYERIARDRWRDALLAYKRLGINTIDLYLMWNWHEPSATIRDFTGTTDPRRDLVGLLKLTHALGFKLILRPGPVIRNEWRNGGYPDWLLERPAYDMPLHDVLEGRYPATATLQNAHADAAAAQWLDNQTHRRYAAAWLRDVLKIAAPYASDVIAIALDDDQGAYIDNDTWPAPHWHQYLAWLRAVVTSVVGPHVPLFVNTFEMKVPAASPVWAWGNWYQSNAYSIGAHDLAELDFATGLLQTQTRGPLMQAEFQAGWLQGADEGAPRPADPSNTTLALHELLRDGMHGIVNFPVQDTINPDGWEVPWANWSYAWDAALTTDLRASARCAPTAAFGRDVAAYGPWLARTHPAADAGIIWPPSLFAPRAVSNADISAFADATIAMQRQCAARGLTCELVDLTYGRNTHTYPALLMPIVPSQRLAEAMLPAAEAQIARLRRTGRLRRDVASIHTRHLAGADDATLLLADDGSYGFIDAINPSDRARTIGPLHATLARETVTVRAFTLPARSARLVPIGRATALPTPRPPAIAPIATPPPFSDPTSIALGTGRLRVTLAPNAGARIASVSVPGSVNAASSIGLLRDAVDPEPSPSSRDYIAAYTHPMPAGTFNRAYRCAASNDSNDAIACTYDAPDLPQGGGTFSRTLRVQGDELVVDLRLVPNDTTSRAKLVSISGFAFRSGDRLIAPAGANFVAIEHGGTVVALHWRKGDVQQTTLRATRGAELVTLAFATHAAQLRLGIYDVNDLGQVLRLFQSQNAAPR